MNNLVKLPIQFLSILKVAVSLVFNFFIRIKNYQNNLYEKNNNNLDYI